MNMMVFHFWVVVSSPRLGILADISETLGIFDDNHVVDATLGLGKPRDARSLLALVSGFFGIIFMVSSLASSSVGLYEPSEYTRTRSTSAPTSCMIFCMKVSKLMFS